MIIAPNGGDAWAPAKPRPDETLIRALARAHRWKLATDNPLQCFSYDVGRGLGMLRVVLNRGIFGLVVHIL